MVPCAIEDLGSDTSRRPEESGWLGWATLDSGEINDVREYRKDDNSDPVKSDYFCEMMPTRVAATLERFNTPRKDDTLTIEFSPARETRR